MRPHLFDLHRQAGCEPEEREHESSERRRQRQQERSGGSRPRSVVAPCHSSHSVLSFCRSVRLWSSPRDLSLLMLLTRRRCWLLCCAGCGRRRLAVLCGGVASDFDHIHGLDGTGGELRQGETAAYEERGVSAPPLLLGSAPPASLLCADHSRGSSEHERLHLRPHGFRLGGRLGRHGGEGGRGRHSRSDSSAAAPPSKLAREAEQLIQI